MVLVVVAMMFAILPVSANDEIKVMRNGEEWRLDELDIRIVNDTVMVSVRIFAQLGLNEQNVVIPAIRSFYIGDKTLTVREGATFLAVMAPNPETGGTRGTGVDLNKPVILQNGELYLPLHVVPAIMVIFDDELEIVITLPDRHQPQGYLSRDWESVLRGTDTEVLWTRYSMLSVQNLLSRGYTNQEVLYIFRRTGNNRERAQNAALTAARDAAIDVRNEDRTAARNAAVFRVPTPQSTVNRALRDQTSFRSFNFTAADGRELRVFYSRPGNIDNNTRVIFYFHGVGRDPNRSSNRSSIRTLSSHANAVVIAPQFTSELFPTRDYQFIGVQNNINNPENWTPNIVDEIYHYVLERFDMPVSRFIMYGHSAGGQFVHRALMFSQSDYLDFAIAANPASWTFLDYDVNFPYGIGRVYSEHLGLIQSNFGRRLYILTGTRDNDPNAANFTSTPTQNRQQSGANNRHDRALSFYMVSRDYAELNNLPFNWELVIMYGIGHSSDMRIVLDIILGLYDPVNPRQD